MAAFVLVSLYVAFTGWPERTPNRIDTGSIALPSTDPSVQEPQAVRLAQPSSPQGAGSSGRGARSGKRDRQEVKGVFVRVEAKRQARSEAGIQPIVRIEDGDALAGAPARDSIKRSLDRLVATIEDAGGEAGGIIEPLAGDVGRTVEDAGGALAGR